MEYQLKIKPSVDKELKDLAKADYYKILSAFTVLSKDPFVGKKMEGEYKNCYNYRVWPYRIIYQIHKKALIILIIRVGHRQGVY
ncbi:MAG: type II toxin-antitoxin system RelE/ParE family toxin [Candidatus Azambacteria bacterium]|nr:type II toxin-antitoxin system RelE/ParE family toxin [Candidatus Azambacteria bacterium]